MTSPPPTSGRRATTRSNADATRTQFWVVAGLGPLAAIIAWGWYGFAHAEAQSEQGKALSAGTTMAGFAEVIGGIPLVLAHVIGLMLLVVVGGFGYGRRGILYAVGAVLAASVIGICVAQWAFGGQLFELGVGNETFVP